MSDDWEFELGYFINDELNFMHNELNIDELGTMINTMILIGESCVITGAIGGNTEFYIAIPAKSNGLGDTEDFIRLLEYGEEF